MKIGNLEIENNIFLAPMSGITDISFRIICKEMGAGFVFTEMVQSNMFLFNYNKVEKMISILPQEKPVGVQLYGYDPDIIARACEIINVNKDISLVNINMGCPAPKILKRGAGAILMKNVKLSSEIVKKSKKTTSKPITVKIRKGFDENSINAVEFSKEMEQAGVDAIFIHGRTAKQFYLGKADWEIISEVKKSVKIPVIGNGDIFCADDALSMMVKTNCDGVMVARGAIGNPWIFKQIQNKINMQEIHYPTKKDKIDICIRQYQSAIEHYGKIKGVHEMRKIIAYYIRGMENSAQLKRKVYTEKEPEKVIELLKNYKEFLS